CSSARARIRDERRAATALPCAKLRPSAYRGPAPCSAGMSVRFSDPLELPSPNLHAHTPLKQVHGNDEHRSSLVPRLDEALEAGEGTGDHAHPIADPDPRHGTRPLDVGHHAADGLDLPLRNRVEGVPPLPEDADDALRARDADVSLAARRKAEKEIAGEQRALENDTAVAPPARDPCARKEDLETLP